MANPVYSFKVKLDQVHKYHTTEDGTNDEGTFPCIPVMAAIRYFKNEVTLVKGYSITFEIADMEKAAASAMGANVADITTAYDEGELTITTAYDPSSDDGDK